MISSCSSSRSKRSLVDGKGTPYAVCSSPYQPAPIPSSTRPLLMSSTWATAIASGPGRRKVAEVTIVPSRMVLVSRAMAPSVTQLSVGPGHAARVGRRLADHQQVVRSEERIEAELFGELGYRQLLLVGGALLRFDEDPKVHAAHHNLVPATEPSRSLQAL